MLALHLAGVGGERVAELERRVAGALRMILVSDRRAEQRHDAVAGKLVDETLEVLDTLGEDVEEALHDLRPRLGVHLLGELHRALHVREQHGDLLALAFEGAARGEDLLGEMLGRVGRRRSRRCRRRTGRQRDAAAAAELLAGLVRGATRGADRREHRAAFGTVPALCTVVVVTGRAPHRVSSGVR